MMVLLHMLIPYRAISIGIIIGMASHIILDMCTKKGGVKLFFPATVSIRFPLTTKTGSKVEGVVLMLLSMLSIYFSYELIVRFIDAI